jgi:hypothetical protein
MKKKQLKSSLAGLAFTLACGAAGAQGVYRCGDTYSQQPCPGGVPVATEDARNAAQRTQATAAAQREAGTAEAMEKARLKEEAKPVAAGHVPLPARQEVSAPNEPVLNHPKKPQHFTASVPKKPGDKPAKKKAKAKKAKTPAPTPAPKSGA